MLLLIGEEQKWDQTTALLLAFPEVWRAALPPHSSLKSPALRGGQHPQLPALTVLSAAVPLPAPAASQGPLHVPAKAPLQPEAFSHGVTPSQQ